MGATYIQFGDYHTEVAWDEDEKVFVGWCAMGTGGFQFEGEGYAELKESFEDMLRFWETSQATLPVTDADSKA